MASKNPPLDVKRTSINYVKRASIYCVFLPFLFEALKHLKLGNDKADSILCIDYLEQTKDGYIVHGHIVDKFLFDIPKIISRMNVEWLKDTVPKFDKGKLYICIKPKNEYEQKHFSRSFQPCDIATGECLVQETGKGPSISHCEKVATGNSKCLVQETGEGPSISSCEKIATGDSKCLIQETGKGPCISSCEKIASGDSKCPVQETGEGPCISSCEKIASGDSKCPVQETGEGPSISSCEKIASGDSKCPAQETGEGPSISSCEKIASGDSKCPVQETGEGPSISSCEKITGVPPVDTGATSNQSNSNLTDHGDMTVLHSSEGKKAQQVSSKGQSPVAFKKIQCQNSVSSKKGKIARKKKNSVECNTILSYETCIEEDGNKVFRLFVESKKDIVLVPDTGKGQFDVTSELHVSGKKSFYSVTVEQKHTKPKEKLIDCLYVLKENLRKMELPVLVIDDEVSYLNEILLQGFVGARNHHDIRLIQFGKFVFEVDYFDFYVYGIVAVVFTPGIEPAQQWPWKNENNVPVEPPDNDLTSYEDLVTRMSGHNFFHLLGQAMKGKFCSVDVSNASKIDCQLILALTFSEPIRNHLAVTDNEILYRSESIIEDIRSFLPGYYPMMACGTFRDRKTGFHGEKNSKYRKRRDKFIEQLDSLKS